MIKFECNACGGSLKEDGRFWICENCGTKYALGRDDEGKPFTYQPVEKKNIECGQIGTKASALEVSEIAVREIKLKDNINIEIHNESLNLDTNEIIKNTELYIEAKEWEKVQEQINRLLIADQHCAQAQWFVYMCNKRISSEKQLIESWTDFSQADKIKLDDILANSSPEFAKHIIELMFNYAYVNDNMCHLILSAILPYAKNEIIYEAKEFEEKIANAFKTVIDKTYEDSFVFLLTHTLNSDEVDKYINYLEKFAGNCAPAVSQKYYQMIIDVDPGNIAIRKKLINADLKSDTYKDKCIKDFEGLLAYSTDADEEAYELISYLASEKTTTHNKSNLFWELLGYHSEAPDGLIDELSKFAFVLLNSSLWEEARKFFNLILSVNSRYAKAYFGLCLVRLQARNENDIAFKKDNLIDCPEFDKCLALYRSEKNEQKVAELMSYAKNQKDTKQTKKLLTRIGIIVAAVILLIFAINKISYARKYSVNNIVISVADKDNNENAAYYSGYETELTLEVKNKSSQGINAIDGEMKIYNSDDDLLMDVKAKLNVNVESGETSETTLKINSNNTKNIEELYALDLENLKITFKVTAVIYEDYNQTEYPDSKEKVINKITEEKSYKEVKASKLKTQYNKAMSEYKKIDINSATFEDDVVNVISLLDDVWEDLLASDKYLDDLYSNAMEYKNNEEYEKAYFLFGLLSSAEYKDSDIQANECYDMAIANY